MRSCGPPSGRRRDAPLGVIVLGYLVGSLAAAAPIPAGGVLEGGQIGARVLYGAPLAPAAGAVLLYRAHFTWPSGCPQRYLLVRPAAATPRAAWTTTEPHSRLTG
jgi:hypothetical protein